MTDLPPSGYPPGYRPPPAKYRPSAAWFVVGIGLVLAAAAVAVGMFVWLLVGFLHTDATVSVDGQPHRVTVGTDGDRMLWTSAAGQSCRVVDLATGQQVPMGRVSGSFTRSDSNGDFTGVQRFDPGSGRLEVTCTPFAGPRDVAGGDTVLIGPMPRIGSFVVGILVAILVPGLLGLAGFVVLMVTGILWSTRQPRPKRT